MTSHQEGFLQQGEEDHEEDDHQGQQQDDVPDHAGLFRALAAVGQLSLSHPAIPDPLEDGADEADRWQIHEDSQGNSADGRAHFELHVFVAQTIHREAVRLLLEHPMHGIAQAGAAPVLLHFKNLQLAAGEDPDYRCVLTEYGE